MRPESVEICLFDKEDNDRRDDFPFSNLPNGNRELIIRLLECFGVTQPLINLNFLDWEELSQSHPSQNRRTQSIRSSSLAWH
jgi:hypothetical protein